MPVPIKVSRMPEYLSPSSISKSQQEPHKFFAIYLAPEEFKMAREPTTVACAVGTMFDVMIKQVLHEEKGIPCAIPFQEVLDTRPDKHLIGEALTAAKLLMAPYRRARMHMTAGFVQVEGKYDQEYTFPISSGVLKTIPLLGKLDAVVRDPETGMLVPLDWKCSGYTSKSGMSPKIGFKRIWDSKKNTWGGAHKKYYNNMPVTDINIGWARQFTIYAIMLNQANGVPFGTPTPVWVHHPIFNGVNKTVKIAEYRAVCTKEIQQYFWDEAVHLWESLLDGSFLRGLNFQGEDEFTYSALASYANECESFFREPSKSANELSLGAYFD